METSGILFWDKTISPYYLKDFLTNIIEKHIMRVSLNSLFQVYFIKIKKFILKI